MLLHHLLGNRIQKAMVSDPNKPVVVVAGTDSLEQLGSGSDTGGVGLRVWIDTWKETFGQKEQGTPELCFYLK